MTSLEHYEIDDQAGRAAEALHRFPTRVAAAVVIVVALVFADAMPRPSTTASAPSACGADSAAPNSLS